MNASALKQMEIMNELSLVPKEKLSEVQQFIHQIISSEKIKEKKRGSLANFWKGVGFEKINIENEIDQLRKELGNNIERKFTDQ